MLKGLLLLAFFLGCVDNEFCKTGRGTKNKPTFKALRNCFLGKILFILTIWLHLVYSTVCQFVLINHAYTSILITPCVAALS